MNVEQMLEQCCCVMKVHGRWYVRKEGSSSYSSTAGHGTAREALEHTFGATQPRPVLITQPTYKSLLPGVCPVCKAPVFDTASGVVCGSGHGGIEPVVTPVDDDLFGDDNADLF